MNSRESLFALIAALGVAAIGAAWTAWRAPSFADPGAPQTPSRPVVARPTAPRPPPFFLPGVDTTAIAAMEARAMFTPGGGDDAAPQNTPEAALRPDPPQTTLKPPPPKPRPAPPAAPAPAPEASVPGELPGQGLTPRQPTPQPPALSTPAPAPPMIARQLPQPLPPGPVAPPGSIKLRGVFNDNGRLEALLLLPDRALVRVGLGAAVAGWRVTQIERGRAVLSRGGAYQIINLPNQR